MDQCYVHLAIVEQSSRDKGHTIQGNEIERDTTSRLSLLARKNVETPDETIQVNLASLFS